MNTDDGARARSSSDNDKKKPFGQKQIPLAALSSFPSHYYDALDESLQMLNRCNKNVIIMGDVNINMCSDQYSPLLHQYLDTLYSNGFTCCVNKPTRIASSSQTAIDHIMTNIV